MVNVLDNELSDGEIIGLLNKLKEPLPAEKISWKPKQVIPKDFKKREASKDNVLSVRVLLMPYIDARNMMDVLDDVVGPHRWKTSYRELSDGKLICTIYIKVNDEWVSKEDGTGSSGDESSDDGQSQGKRDTGKGDFTVAFRRTAQGPWGIGRYLYQFAAPWVNGTYDGRKLRYDIPDLSKSNSPPPLANDDKPNTTTRKQKSSRSAKKPTDKQSTNTTKTTPKREANDNKDGLTQSMLEMIIPDGTGAPVKDVKFADLVEKWNRKEGDDGYREDDKEFVEVVIGYLAGIKKSPMGKEFQPTDDQQYIKGAAVYIWKHVLNLPVAGEE